MRFSGVYTGFSALSVAEVLPDDGVVYAFDISEENVNIGKPVWKEVRHYSVMQTECSAIGQVLFVSAYSVKFANV